MLHREVFFLSHCPTTRDHTIVYVWDSVIIWNVLSFDYFEQCYCELSYVLLQTKELAYSQWIGTVESLCHMTLTSLP